MTDILLEAGVLVVRAVVVHFGIASFIVEFVLEALVC